MSRVLYVAAAALFDSQDRILLAQRPQGKAMAGLWEFPGGKIEPNETPEDALVRELKEELSIQVNASLIYPLTFASHAYPAFHLFMPLFGLKEWQGTPTPVEGQNLAWVERDNLLDYPAPEADLPLFRYLIGASSGVWADEDIT